MKTKLVAFSFLFTLMTMVSTSFLLPENRLTQVIFNGTLAFIFGIFISVGASKQKCKKVSKLRSLWHGVKMSALYVGVYYLITVVPIFKTPIKMAVKDDKIAGFIANLIYLTILTIFVSRNHYKNSVKKVCNICSADLEANLKKYEEYLNKPF